MAQDEGKSNKYEIVTVADPNTVKVLKYLLDMAISGQISGVACIAERNVHRHKIAITGTYRTHAHRARTPLERLEETLREIELEQEETIEIKIDD